ncbi:MAG TPA: rhamnulokinase family protein [Oscillospiraceae bacterium]|nr:rhamnulokinase family protein [Oscillospiraceae bacterium]HPS34546.1 rhamnulokinase family protein [Oscillospiraceae bacterium]
MAKKVLAFDFGASSGRAVIGSLTDGKITLEEIHRFSNDPVTVNGTLYWDFLRLYHEILQGISKAVIGGHEFDSVGIDTWGVDFGLLDKNGKLLENVIHYRDSRTDGIPDEVFKITGKKPLYYRTGIQFMWFNTIFQLYSLAKHRPELLKHAKTLLLIPDLLCYFLTGNKTNEFTMASTTQLLNSETGGWDKKLLKKLGIPSDIFAPLVEPGTPKGVLNGDVCKQTGCKPVKVCAVAEHDTGSAVLAVPAAKDEKFAFISCGTWSLLGAELPKPLISDATYELNYSNEGGVNRTARFLKNIMGLWLMQECRNQWNREGRNLSFKDIDNYTAQSKPLSRFVNPDDEMFKTPGDMPARIRQYCERTNQPLPEGIGDYSRCITESLAMAYRYATANLEKLLGYPLDVIHLVGGGVKDKLLCQFAANALGRPVVAGPIEATGIGNVCMQLIAEGEFKDVHEARDCIAKSFDVVTYRPIDTAVWNEAYQRYLGVCGLKE